MFIILLLFALTISFLTLENGGYFKNQSQQETSNNNILDNRGVEKMKDDKPKILVFFCARGRSINLFIT